MATAVTPHREEADAAQLVRTTTNDLRAEREFPVAPQYRELVAAVCKLAEMPDAAVTAEQMVAAA